MKCGFVFRVPSYLEAVAVLDSSVACGLDVLQPLVERLLVLDVQLDIERTYQITELDFLSPDVYDLALGVVVGKSFPGTAVEGLGKALAGLLFLADVRNNSRRQNSRGSALRRRGDVSDFRGGFSGSRLWWNWSDITKPHRFFFTFLASAASTAGLSESSMSPKTSLRDRFGLCGEVWVPPSRQFLR